MSENKMFSILLTKLRKKSRKYPIHRDEYGKSARQRAFDVFDQGKRPAEVSRVVGISLRTACRYFADWKKLPKNLGIRYRIAKRAWKTHPEFSEEMIKTVAACLGMSEEEVVMRLEKPWGLKQLLMGDWPNYAREKIKSEREFRLQAALEMIRLIEHSGMMPEEITEVISALIRDAGKHKAAQRD